MAPLYRSAHAIYRNGRRVYAVDPQSCDCCAPTDMVVPGTVCACEPSPSAPPVALPASVVGPITVAYANGFCYRFRAQDAVPDDGSYTVLQPSQYTLYPTCLDCCEAVEPCCAAGWHGFAPNAAIPSSLSIELWAEMTQCEGICQNGNENSDPTCLVAWSASPPPTPTVSAFVSFGPSAAPPGGCLNVPSTPALQTGFGAWAAISGCAYLTQVRLSARLFSNFGGLRASIGMSGSSSCNGPLLFSGDFDEPISVEAGFNGITTIESTNTVQATEGNCCTGPFSPAVFEYTRTVLYHVRTTWINYVGCGNGGFTI